MRPATLISLAKRNASTKRKGSLLKATQAAGAVADADTKEKLHGFQEKQIAASKGTEGNWLVLGDKSTSMREAIEAARQVAATLAKMVKGNVSLIFFDSQPRYVDATGKSYDAILEATRRVEAVGSTSIGCGLLAARGSHLDIDGIAIVSDAQENTAPRFVDQYAALVKESDKLPPVYLYRCAIGARGATDVDLADSMRHNNFDLQEFDLRGMGTDYYSIPNMVATMRANRYGLVQEILDTPLLEMKNVLNTTRRERVA